jgi:hypothetical protein
MLAPRKHPHSYNEGHAADTDARVDDAPYWRIEMLLTQPAGARVASAMPELNSRPLFSGMLIA